LIVLTTAVVLVTGGSLAMMSGGTRKLGTDKIAEASLTKYRFSDQDCLALQASIICVLLFLIGTVQHYSSIRLGFDRQISRGSSPFP
jgi:hypothetical protein